MVIDDDIYIPFNDTTTNVHNTSVDARTILGERLFAYLDSLIH